MTKKDFKKQYKEHDANTALKNLLSSQKDNAIRIPVGLYRLSDPTGPTPTGTEEELIEFLESGESTEVSFKNDNNHECYIAEIRLEEGNVEIKVYDYYRSEFYDVDPYRLINPKDAMDFALEYASFDEENPEEEPGLVHISLAADKGSVADALRQLANYIEECDSDNGSDYPTQYESAICVAEIKEE